MKKSAFIAANKVLSQRRKMFRDNALVDAIVKKLEHHLHIIDIVGVSYRTKDDIDKIQFYIVENEELYIAINKNRKKREVKKA